MGSRGVIAVKETPETIDILLADMGYASPKRHYDDALVDPMPHRAKVPNCVKQLRNYNARFARDKLAEPLEALMNYDL